jgi:hypothetical protein
LFLRESKGASLVGAWRKDKKEGHQSKTIKMERSTGRDRHQKQGRRVQRTQEERELPGCEVGSKERN